MYYLFVTYIAFRLSYLFFSKWLKYKIKSKLEKVDLVITDTPTFQIFIQKPLKSLSSKRKWGHNSWTVNVNFTIIKLNLYFMVHRIVLKFEKIWLSRTLNIIRKPRKSLFSKRKRAITYGR
jgi:hypothetical protein